MRFAAVVREHPGDMTAAAHNWTAAAAAAHNCTAAGAAAVFEPLRRDRIHRRRQQVREVQQVAACTVAATVVARSVGLAVGARSLRKPHTGVVVGNSLRSVPVAEVDN